MKNTPVRVLVILAVVAIAGIMFTQVNWVSKALDSHEEQFNHSVQMALRGVVESLCVINGNDIPSNDPIDQVSSNYYIARTNYKIDLKSLDYLIAGEFQKKNIELDFEYGVYDCQTDQMVYGDFVSMNGETTDNATSKLPELNKDEYYFAVYFPSKKAGLANELGFWQFTTVLTILIVMFFGYAMFIILRQKRLSEIQRDFFNNITHEFKTPIATLKVSSEVLAETARDAKQEKYTSIIKDEVNRLEKQVNQLLKASFIDHYQSKNFELMDPQKVLLDVVRYFEEDEELLIQKDFQASGSKMEGDPELLENIFFNLMDNAKKYGNGKLKIVVNESGNQLSITVSNNGPIIPSGELNKIFNKFYRVPSGNLHEVKGFGLGLYFVKQATKLMKGSVAVESKDDLTSLVLKFPIV